MEKYKGETEECKQGRHDYCLRITDAWAGRVCKDCGREHPDDC